MGETEHPLAPAIINLICRSQQPNSYPVRRKLPDEFVDWNIAYPDYDPVPYNAHREQLNKLGMRLSPFLEQVVRETLDHNLS